MAGPEIAVASTKAYTTQVVVMYMMAMYFSELKGLMTKELEKELKEALLLVPEKVQVILDKASEVEEIANLLTDETDVFYLGRGADYALSIEASLKLKEISYIHSEAYAGGELKHGTIALIEEGTKVIALLTQKSLREKMVSNIVEVKARGAEVIAIAYENDLLDESIFDKVIRIPELLNLVSPIVAVVALQLLAYYTARNKGCDIDKPRNLAKSVTVE